MYNIIKVNDLVKEHNIVATLNNVITVSIKCLTFLRLVAKSPKRPTIDLMTTATIPRTIISHLDFDR
jgi:hypothetical protein